MITTIYNAKQSANIADVIAKSYKEQGLTLNDNLYPTIKQERWLEHASEQYDIPDYSALGRIECSRLITAICAGKYPLKAVVETTYYAIIVNENEKVSIKCSAHKSTEDARKHFADRYIVIDVLDNKDTAINNAKLVQLAIDSKEVETQQEERLTYDGLNLLDATVLAELADKLNVSIKGCKKRDTIIKRILMSQVA